MAILPILEAPHPILSKVAVAVKKDQFGEKLVSFISDMVETMYDAPGVGLAAPQVGRSLRILVADPGHLEVWPALRAKDPSLSGAQALSARRSRRRSGACATSAEL